MFSPRPWHGWLNLLAYWILVSALGGVVTYTVIFLASHAVLGEVFHDPGDALTYAGGPMAGAAGGVFTGFGQWLLLRRRRFLAWGWVLGTVVGWAAGLFCTLLIFFWLLPDGIGYSTLLTPFALGGALAGVCQLPILRRWLPAASWWWVVASVMGWTVGWVLVLGWAAGGVSSLNLSPAGTLLTMGSLHGAFLGFESGLALAVLSQLSQVGQAEEMVGQ